MKRYSPVHEDAMVAEDDGTYVLYSDAAAIEKERDSLQIEVGMLRREVSRESQLRYSLRRMLDERESHLSEQRAADESARAVNKEPA